jgi:6-phosphogluconolactonase (cycloisomerase 2 family)
MPLTLLSLSVIYVLSLAFKTEATRLFVASYAGTITTINVSKDHSSGYSLQETTSTLACALPGSPPSWIVLDKKGETLYCTNPGQDLPNGKLFSLDVEKNGSLTPLNSIDTPLSAAYAAIYNNNNALAVAY